MVARYINRCANVSPDWKSGLSATSPSSQARSSSAGAGSPHTGRKSKKIEAFSRFSGVLDVTQRKMAEEELSQMVSERTAALEAEMDARSRAEAALRDAGDEADALRARGHEVELVLVTTEGDVNRAPLSRIGGTGVFVSALRDALLAGEIDIAVHSLKDLPVAQPQELVIAAVPEREDPRDALVARDGLTLETLPAGARVGTGSPRREAQLRAEGLWFEDDEDEDSYDDDEDSEEDDSDDEDDEYEEPVAAPVGRQRRRAAARPAGPPSRD